ncbi:MAG TPA: hypothetical protein VNH11_02570 [Pirellulales bacterium]|nr:hypothetical protein [Pirellulales bacterium]
MKSKFVMVALTVALVLGSQTSVRAYRRGGGGYGGGMGFAGAGTTPLGSAMLGAAAMTWSAGMFNMYTGQAAVSYQQAYQHWIENQKLRTQTYFDMRRMNASYRAEREMQHPHATPDEIVAFNQARLPAPLSANEFDPARGVLDWPALLTRPEFNDERAKLEGLFAQWATDPHGSGLGTQNYRDIQHAATALSDKLHSEIQDFSANEYIAASKFLKSLAYAASKPSTETVAKK